MTRQDHVNRLLASSPLFQPNAGIDEQTLANRAAEALERVKAHDRHFLSLYEETGISDILVQALGLPTQFNPEEL